MKEIIISNYLQEHNLDFEKLITDLKSKKTTGYSYFRKNISELNTDSKLKLFKYRMQPNIQCTTVDNLPLVPIPLKNQIYQKYNDKFKLLEKLAISKISFEEKGYKSRQININKKLIKQNIQLIYRHYDYQNPHLGKEIIWFDLKDPALKTINHCLENNLDGIINGLTIKIN